MEICDIVKKIRTDLKLSQEDFAREIHVGYATVSRWENAHAKPTRMARYMFVEYCKKRKVDPELIELFENTR